jgi:hypothetical protein
MAKIAQNNNGGEPRPSRGRSAATEARQSSDLETYLWSAKIPTC